VRNPRPRLIRNRRCATTWPRPVRRYLHDLGECDSHELYDIVLREIEKPLLNEVMRHYDGNQSRAAATLGINRATLRKKLRQYGI